MQNILQMGYCINSNISNMLLIRNQSPLNTISIMDNAFQEWLKLLDMLPSNTNTMGQIRKCLYGKPSLVECSQIKRII
jgi:hypothetical protein